MITVLFSSLIVVFVLILGVFFVPQVQEFFQGSLLFLAPFVIFSLLGLVLLLVTLKKKEKGRLRKFLILTGASSTGIFVSILLHNLIYGVFIYLFGQGFWERVGLGDEPVFFFLATIVCPLGFLIGVIGSVVLFVKKKDER